MAIKVDSTKFERAFEETLLHTKREFPVVINGSAVDIIIRAADLTKKAEAADIEKSLRTLTSPKSGGKDAELIYLIINSRRKKAKGLNQSQMEAAVAKLIKARKDAIGYTAYAGWNNALKACGGRGFGSKFHSSSKKFGKSNAAQGYGKKAEPGRLVATLVNTATAIEKYGFGPLRQAMDARASELMRHLEDKLAQKCREISR